MKKIILNFGLIINLTLFSQPNAIWFSQNGGNDSDIGRSVVPTTDGGCIIAGESSSSDGSFVVSNGETDGLIVKYNSDGTIAWKKNYGGTRRDAFNSIIASAEGGFICVGITKSEDGDIVGFHGPTSLDNWDIWIVKINSVGDIEWQKCIGGTDYDMGEGITQDSQGNYVIVGISYSTDGDVLTNNGDGDLFVVKIDNSGNVIWKKSFGGSNADEGSSVSFNSNNEYIITGATSSNDFDVTGSHGGSDAWVLKLNNSGNIIWKQCFGGSGDEWLSNIFVDGNNIYLSGSSNSSNGNVSNNKGANDIWVVNLDSNGSIIWEKSIGGTANEESYSLIKSQNNSLILCGMVQSNDFDFSDNNGFNINGIGFFLSMTLDGSIEWKSYLGNSNSSGALGSIISNIQGELFLTGTLAFPSTNNQEVVTFKTSSLAALAELNSKMESKIYPNPSNTFIKVDLSNLVFTDNTSIRISNSVGQEVYSAKITQKEFTIDVSNWSASGTYFVDVLDDKGYVIETRKIVLN